MGRPLKTRKYQQDTGTTVDYGVPNNGNTNNGYDTDNPGIIGGFNGPIRVTTNINLPGAGTVTGNTASAVLTGTGTVFDYNGLQNGSIIYANGVEIGTVSSISNATSLTMTANSTANVSGVTYTFDTGVRDGYIFRQKGKKKFMVIQDVTVQDEGIAAGGTYWINDPQGTDWSQFGAGPDAGYGKVFTSTASGPNVSLEDGTVKPVGICTLVDSNSPAAGEMSMAVYNDGDTTYACSIKNTHVRDFDNNVAPLDNNPDNTQFIATIFNDNGNVDSATGFTIVGVENWC